MARVLLVEDDGLVRKGLHRLLERAGHEVWETAEGKVALKLLSGLNVDVVITDLYMPRMNGLQLIEQLSRRNDRRPLIAISGGGFRAAGDLLEEARRAGATRTFEKPVAASELVGAVADLVGQRDRERPEADTPAAEPAQPE
jgi:CheY-like chemotaxis protein